MKKYNIAFDIGTNSVGWAVIDNEMKLVRHRGQNMWGSRLFSDANSAEERRVYRSTRRRYNRRKFRLKHLQELMKPLIDQVDMDFYNKLENSYRSDEDKVSNLFNEPGFTDKDYFEKYPTIYHLRRELYTCSDKKDPRLIYLALHHIIKKRGNFLFDGSEFNVQSDEAVNDIIGRLFGEENIDLIKKVIVDKDLNNSEKVSEIRKSYKESRKYYAELGKLVVGNKSNFNTIFEYYGLLEKVSSNFNIEEIISEEPLNGDKESDKKLIQEHLAELVEDAHTLYSWKSLQEVLLGHEYLSSAKVASYELHEKDLLSLKETLKEDKGLYKKVFDEGSLYDKYIKSEIDQETLNRTLKKLIDNKELLDSITRNRLEDNELFPLQKTTLNASVPYQLHLKELIKIIENQGKHYPYLLNNKAKFEKVFLYKLPYYVGPINDKSEFSTVVFKGDYKELTPYNLEQVVDLEKSAEKFMNDRIGHCTYLLNEQVLPKQSLMYQMYEVLNELNGIRINGSKISMSLKKEIIEKLFKTRKRISDNALKSFLVKEGFYEDINQIEIKGYQADNAFSTSMSSYIDFKDFFDVENEREMIENLILWVTLFEDKKIKRIKVEREYPHLTKVQIDKIMTLNYSGWGRFSKKLINGITTTVKGEDKTILDLLNETNKVFMQIINDSQYSFENKINEIQQKHVKKGKITYSDIDELYASSRVKRGLWQSVKLLEEIIDIQGYKPDKIFIEFARSDEEKGLRTLSRKDQLLDALKNNSEDKYLLEELKDSVEGKISERLYLYFSQRGKCMYTGESLDINNLSLYHIDHIIPQSVIKDDSLDNKVLVKDQENYRKSGSMFIDPNVIQRNITIWQSLLDKNLISNKKFYNLIRKGNEEDEEKLLDRFIQRQLVETRQISKYFRNILEAGYPEIEIHSLQAGIISVFREKNGFYKTRLANNFHHAKDAYILGCVGEFVTERYSFLFSKDRWKFIDLKSEVGLNKSNNKHYKNKEHFITYNFRLNKIDYDTGEIIWEGEKFIKTMRQTLSWNDVLVTMQPTVSTSEFYDQTIYSKEDSMKRKLYPRNEKMMDVSKYGGYSSLKPAYMAIIKGINRRNKEEYRLVNVPNLYRKSEPLLLSYLEIEYNLRNIEFIRSKIFMNQLVKTGGMYVRLASAHEWNNATELYISPSQEEFLYRLERNWEVDEKEIIEFYDYLISRIEEYYPLYGSFRKKMMDLRADVLSKNIEEKRVLILNLTEVLKASKQTPTINLYGLNYGSRLGRMNGKNMKVSESSFIFESITGLRNREWKVKI